MQYDGTGQQYRDVVKAGVSHEKIRVSSVRWHVNGHKFCRAFDGFSGQLRNPIWGSNGCTRRSAALWRVLPDCYVWPRKSLLRFAARAIAERLVATGEVVRDY